MIRVADQLDPDSRVPRAQRPDASRQFTICTPALQHRLIRD
ncbi:MAG TPA: hypothetical protein VLB68_31705 [Pyrinomonadaceae bacterium]|nr:hypothetical protein [Pyrinomonadaceae bacterium]